MRIVYLSRREDELTCLQSETIKMAFKIVSAVVVLAILQTAHLVVCINKFPAATSATFLSNLTQKVNRIAVIDRDVEDAFKRTRKPSNETLAASARRDSQKLLDFLHKRSPINERQITNDEGRSVPVQNLSGSVTTVRSVQDDENLVLNSSFVELFDEILQIKNNSFRALLQLEYFKPNRSTNKPKPIDIELDDSPNGDSKQSNKTDKQRGQTNPKKPPLIKLIPTPTNSTRTPDSTIRVIVKNNQPIWTLTSVHSHVQNWLANLNLKLNRMLAMIKPTSTISRQPLAPSPRQVVGHEKQTGPGAKNETGHRVAKRDSPEEPDEPVSKNRCPERDEVKCRETEVSIKSNLERSFPGTLEAIEKSCHQIAFLLGGCWPRQLENLKQSLASWNESLVALADFPIPKQASQDALANGCPQYSEEPKVSGAVLERINWMWLNLCMDKKFRQDYLDNMRCLSLWTQERSQSVCNNEYKRMQSNLDRVSAEGVIQMASSAQSPTNVTSMINAAHKMVARTFRRSTGMIQPQDRPPSSTGGVPMERSPDTVDRELESKTLCCLFDVFLRCVHKQAVRDCGRSGAQFVVNFMSRIGTEDMKYICNNDPNKLNQRQPQKQQGTRRGPGERGPFIDGNYCVDPRIYGSLFGGSGGQNSSGSRGNSTVNENVVKRPPPSKLNSHNGHKSSSSNNLESTLFPGETAIADPENAAISSSPTMALVLAYCSLAFVFNAGFLKE